MAKLGRNDPCPCNSGKKYKRCCGATGSSQSVGKPPKDVFLLNEEIAYLGPVGQRRAEFCRGHLDKKAQLYDRIRRTQEDACRERGRSVQCHKGCSYCCTEYVGGALSEVEATVYWLYNNKPVLKHFRGNYPVWRDQIRKCEDVFKRANELGGALFLSPEDKTLKEEFLKVTETYRKLNIGCPFLDSGACSIYPARPLVCASLVSASDPALCSRAAAGTPQRLLSDVKVDLPYLAGKPENRVFMPFALGVYQTLQGGYEYLALIPGLKGFAEEALSSPEVKARINSWGT
jgi:Fe-S-cluster containining protein